MADIGTSGPGAAPGQQTYNGSHMPTPLSIPQNNSQIPTSVTSPMGNNGMGSPTISAGGSIRRSAPEPNKRALYVGGLDPRVTEEVLKQIFETTGHVQSVKIIPDKNVSTLILCAHKLVASSHYRKSMVTLEFKWLSPLSCTTSPCTRRSSVRCRRLILPLSFTACVLNFRSHLSRHLLTSQALYNADLHSVTVPIKGI